LVIGYFVGKFCRYLSMGVFLQHGSLHFVLSHETIILTVLDAFRSIAFTMSLCLF